MLAEHERGFGPADAFRRHDLVGGGVLQHAVLMDAALVREGVAPDDRLVGLHVEAGDDGEQARQFQQLGRLDAVAGRHGVGAGAQRHHDLFQRRVAGAFADAVDRAFDLARAGANGRERVGDREAEIVVVVGGEDHAFGAGHAGAEHGEDACHVLGQRVADGVRDVDRGGAASDRDFDAAAQEVGLGAAAVLGRPFDVVGVTARDVAAVTDGVEHRLGLHPELVLHVQRRGADEVVHPLPLGGADRLAGARDVVAAAGAGEAGDHRAADLAGDALHALEIARRGDREAGLDHVDAELGEGARHAELLLEVHREAGALLAVAERGVEDDDAIVVDRAEARVVDGHGGGPRSVGARCGVVISFP